MKVRSILTVLAVLGAVLAATTSPAGAQTAQTCDDLPATIVGTNGDDVIQGTPGPDVIVALGGNDRIFGGGGGDTICAVSGNNFIKGQQGNDYIVGGLGKDVIFGNAGGDTIFGLSGNDILWGGVGPDTIHAGPGDDTIKAGHGNDVAIGGFGNDVIEGSTGADGLVGGPGIDTLVGGIGFDEMLGGNGADLLIGGGGDDILHGEEGRNRCRVDHRDSYTGCVDGNVSGEYGTDTGRFRVDLSEEFELDANSGPFYVMNVNASPSGEVGDRFRITIRDANRVVLLDAEFSGETDHNVLVVGEPAEVEILGAATWNIAFVKEAAVAQNQQWHVNNADDVFAIVRSPDVGQPTSVVVTNAGTVPERIIIMSVGDIGLNVELDTVIEPGQEETFSGDTRPSAKYIAVYAGKNVIWGWSLDAFVAPA